MKSIPAALRQHLAGTATRLCTCWLLTRLDGQSIRSTDHDQPVTVLTGDPLAAVVGTYQARTGITGSSVRATDDLAVNNLEIAGQITAPGFVVDHLSVADIEAGLFDGAEIIIFQCRWDEPDDGQIILARGHLGDLRRTAEGAYSAEMRGLTQKLSQIRVRTYAPTCDAELGDARCGVDLDALTITGTVDTVTSRRAFATMLAFIASNNPQGTYNGGRITFTSGANTGYSRELRSDSGSLSPQPDEQVTGALILFEPMPADVAPGDTFTLAPGCDKLRATCREKFANVVNFRGYGALIPGQDAFITGFEQVQEDAGD